MSCIICNDPTKETIIYKSQEFCEDCLKKLFVTTPREIIEVYLIEDCLEEFA